VPRTVIVETPTPDLLVRTGLALDGGAPEDFPPEWADYMQQVQAAADCMGYPLFMRTDLFSGKHEWEKTCYVAEGKDLGQHILDLVILGECMSLWGFNHRAVALRKFLNLDSPFVAPGFKNMPVAREWRYFVRDGKIQCRHFYWVEDAVAQSKPIIQDWQARLRDLQRMLPSEQLVLDRYAKRVAQALPGCWSVDFAFGADGTIYLIDMATGEDSWHPECAAAERAGKEA